MLPGAEFTRHAEVVFYPGNHRLSIIQTGRGFDDNNHLTVDTVVSGDVPFLPPGGEITINPFKETYQYYPSGNHSNHNTQILTSDAPLPKTSFSFCSCHLLLCEGVFSGFGGQRLGVLLLPAEAEHHLPRLSPRQPRCRPRDAAAHHGEGVRDVRKGRADPEIRHHQQDQPSRR